MGAGRFVCVAIPFILTLGSLVALLVGGLAGVADKNLFMFEVNTTSLSISPSDAVGLVSSRSPLPDDNFGIFHDPSLLNDTANIAAGGNITAADLGLLDVYEISLWNFCYTMENGTKGCTQPEFNWAAEAFNGTKNNFAALSTLSGGTIAIPKAITDAISAFTTITKWTEVVFIAAYICLSVELFFGLFTSCSRVISCVTWIVAGIATVAVGGAAAMSTAMAAIVVGAVEGSAKGFGVTASVNTGFLAAVWIAVLFAIAAGLFWIFTICCCAPDHHTRTGGRRRGGQGRFADEQGEKLMPIGAYQPLHEPQQNGIAPNSYSYAPQYGPRYPSGAPRSDLAYEPYSHANV